jgi:Thiol:disulfide interchange protein DsbD, N-terminal
MNGAKHTLFGLYLLVGLAAGQDLTASKKPSVSLVPNGLTSVTAGKGEQAQLRFRISPGFHINSNTPKSEFLIPTVLRLDAPTDIVVGKISYPAGQDMSFPFAPNEKLSVYSGEFTVGVLVRPLHGVIPGKYMFRGQLRYQACDNAACYPPKNLPVQFEVKVAKAPKAHVSNPAQSPHVHH